MSAIDLMTEIMQADGELWMDGDKLKFRSVPARLIPAIREHKTALMALLSSPDHIEIAAIQEESELPPFDDPIGTAGVPGFDGMLDLTPAQHGVILHRLMELQ